MNEWNSLRYRNEILPRIKSYIEQARWYSGKGREITGTDLLDFGTMGSPPEVIIAVIRITFRKGGSEVYLVTHFAGSDSAKGIVDGVNSRAYISTILDAIYRGSDISLEKGRLHGMSENFHEFHERVDNSFHVIAGEQSNTSILIGNRWVYKSFRKLNSGENPDFSVASYLYRKCNFPFVPETLGKMTLETGGESYDAGILTRYIGNSRDGWEATLASIRNILSEFYSGESGKAMLLVENLKDGMRKLAKTTAMMHNCLSLDSDDVNFQPEPVSERDVTVWSTEYDSLLEDMFEALHSFTENASENTLKTVEEVLGRQDYFHRFTGPLKKSITLGIYKTRIHGDFHLGQTLVSGDNYYVIDFEGEPMRPLSYRTGKFMPLKDAGGMVRSISYAVDTASSVSEELHMDTAFNESLKESLVDAFVSAYYKSYAPGNPYIPEDPASRRGLLEFFIAEKALYEVVYEIRNRPGYAWIPLRSMRNLIPARIGKKQSSG